MNRFYGIVKLTFQAYKNPKSMTLQVRGVHLCADCHCEKGASSQCFALDFITDIIGLCF